MKTDSPSPVTRSTEASCVHGARQFAPLVKVRHRGGQVYGLVLMRLRKYGWLVAWQDGTQVSATDESLDLVDAWPELIRKRMELIEAEARRRLSAQLERKVNAV